MNVKLNPSTFFSKKDIETEILETFNTTYSCNSSDGSNYSNCVNGVISNQSDLSYQYIAIGKNNNDINTKAFDISINYDAYFQKRNEVSNNFDLIDDSGNLTFISNTNFKSSIPNLKTTVLEDTNDLANYQNNIYVTTSLISVMLVVVAILIVKR